MAGIDDIYTKEQLAVDYKATPKYPDLEALKQQLAANAKAQQQTTEEILADRGKEYGSFEAHARLTQQLYQITLLHRENTGKQMFDQSQREALHMIFHKIGRIANGNPNHIDSWVDIAGYAQLVVDILRNENKF